MRRTITVIAMLAFCLLTIQGCTAPKTTLTLATGGASGTYASLGVALSELFNKEIKNIEVAQQNSSGSVENCKLLGGKKAELAIIQNDILDYAYNGKEIFKDKEIKNITTVAALYPEAVQIIVTRESGIETIEGLDDHKLSVGAPDSGVEVNARQLLDAAGMSYEDMAVSYLSLEESISLMREGRLDGFVFTSGLPNANIQKLAADKEITVLSLPEDIIKRLVNRHRFMTEYTIPAGTYIGQSTDVRTVAVIATLAVRADVPEKVVYELTKTLFEKHSLLAESESIGAKIKLETALSGVSIPVHKGAERYYREKGIIE